MEAKSGKSTNSGPKKGADLRYNLDISFEEAFLGIERYVTITRSETCNTCHGNGAKPGTKPEKCSVCGWYRSNKTSTNNNIRTNANN